MVYDKLKDPRHRVPYLKEEFPEVDWYWYCPPPPLFETFEPAGALDTRGKKAIMRVESWRPDDGPFAGFDQWMDPLIIRAYRSQWLFERKPGANWRTYPRSFSPY